MDGHAPAAGLPTSMSPCRPLTVDGTTVAGWICFAPIHRLTKWVERIEVQRGEAHHHAHHPSQDSRQPSLSHGLLPKAATREEPTCQWRRLVRPHVLLSAGQRMQGCLIQKNPTAAAATPMRAGARGRGVGAPHSLHATANETPRRSRLRGGFPLLGGVEPTAEGESPCCGFWPLVFSSPEYSC